MALTPFRWIAAFVIGCLVVGLTISPTVSPTTDDPVERDLVARLDIYGAHTRVLASRLRTMRLIDSTRPVIARAAVAPYRVFFDRAVPAEAVPALSALAQRATRNMGTPSHNGVDVVFLFGDAAAVGGANWGTDYVLPTRSGERCTVYLRIGREMPIRKQIVQIFNTDYAARQLLGPCAFYGAFGMPGANIDRWLRARGWAFAGDGSWTTEGPPDAPDYWAYGNPIQLIRGARPILYQLSTTGLRCAGGELAACDSATLAARPINPMRVWNGNIMARPYHPLRYGYTAGTALGEREPSMLADMVRTLGRGRFATFWTSADPMPAAFEHAAAMPLSRWVSSWLATQYGPLESGPSVGAWPTAFALVLIGFAIYVGLRLSAHRQYA